MTHLELFAGIGGFRRALDLLTQDGVMPFECVGFSEIDEKAKITYKSNFNTENELDMGDIVAFTKDKEQMDNLPPFDLLTGGFPCQTFSMMGKQAGFAEDRGQMFFRIWDILELRRPKYVLLENVRNLQTHDNKRTFGVIKQKLEQLDYKVFANVFNTSDFHLPQTRNRVLIFATTEAVPANFTDTFTPKSVKELFDKNFKNLSTIAFDSVIPILEKDVDRKYYLSERIKPTILSDGSAGFKSNSEINKIIARPLTASMHKMHRACQDNYYSTDFIESDGKVNHAKDYTKEQLAQLDIRKLTPKEAFMLQGFPAEFVQNANNAGVADGALYKQAGNAVSVNVIYAVIYYLINNNIIHE